MLNLIMECLQILIVCIIPDFPPQGGRANGRAVFLNQRGSVLYGEWRENRRMGPFRVLDHNGNVFHENYHNGERSEREKQDANLSSENLTGTLCVRCQCRFFPEFNHPYACRRVKDETNPGAIGARSEPEWEYSQHYSFI